MLTSVLSPEDLKKLRRSPVNGKNRVKLAMDLAGMKQVQVAAALGRNQGYVSAIVRGAYADMPLETSRKWADLFGCYIEDLFPAVDEQVA